MNTSTSHATELNPGAVPTRVIRTIGRQPAGNAIPSPVLSSSRFGNPALAEPADVELLTFEYTSARGGLATAYTSGSLAAEFGPEAVRVVLCTDIGERIAGDPLLSEMSLSDAVRTRLDTRLLGVVSDREGSLSAITTSHVNLERRSPLVVRALAAVLQARSDRRPALGQDLIVKYPAWVAEQPLLAAKLMRIGDSEPDLLCAA